MKDKEAWVVVLWKVCECEAALTALTERASVHVAHLPMAFASV